MQPSDGHILLARALLTLDEPRRAVHADNQVARHLQQVCCMVCSSRGARELNLPLLLPHLQVTHLGIQRARVARLLHPQNALDPGNHLMGGRV